MKEIVEHHKAAVLLLDIEGAEFQLLDDKMLNLLRHCHVIIELHDPLVEGGEAQKKALMERASKYFDIEIMMPSDIEVSAYPELAGFSDKFRLLGFSEGRRVLMEWAVLTPLHSSSE